MRILYGIQGTGNGHITRARVMATTFKALGVDVDYVFSGRKEQDYFDMDEFADYRAFRGLSFTSKSGQVDSLKTLKNARPLQLIRDIKNLDLRHYDLVFNDFEPITAWAAKQQGIPVIGMSHQAAFLSDKVPMFGRAFFRRALIRGEMGADWVSYGDRLPVNRAMPFWLDHAEGADISPYTLAAAQGAGWMWQIPTYERMGCGYVYSDQFLTPDQAQAEIETALGHPIEPRNDIKIDAGRLDRAWIGNCLAVGLAQSFFEPLEATSIHGTIVQMMLFGQFHLGGLGQDDAKQRDSYNDQIAQQLDDFCTFINLHYVTERDDTPFWQHVRENCIGPEIRNRLLQWSVRTPRREDFAPFPGGLAHIEEQLYYPVLDGLGLTNRDLAREELGQFPQLRSHARASHEALVKEFKRVATQAPGHRAFLDSLHQ